MRQALVPQRLCGRNGAPHRGRCTFVAPRLPTRTPRQRLPERACADAGVGLLPYVTAFCG